MWKLSSERDLIRKNVDSIWDSRRFRDSSHSHRSQTLQRVAVPHEGNELAILRHDPIPCGIESHGGADNRRLLSKRGGEDAVEALALQRCSALVVDPRHQHPTQGLDQSCVGHALLCAVDQLSIGRED